ncbi:uncharacterized protein LOC142567969 [Dermacentor variabilis]|uniref:uncharacterized protein LOC142567969 n=1 Tax=Dermacentor variabilis TaxID=34621 RepID=UPI003F5C5B59
MLGCCSGPQCRTYGTNLGVSLPTYLQDKKPGPLPSALKEGVTLKLEWLQRDDIWVPVKTSEWTAPIVPVLKRGGRVNICGDFKVTITPVATVEKYPCPGLKISAIFQREMDNLFRDMRHVAVYLDDILVSRSDNRDHLQNLHNVLARLQDAGLKLKDQDRHFQRSKELITKAPVLAHFDPAKPVVPTVDVPPYGVGPVLADWDNDGQERNVSFASRRLHAAEQHYSQLHKEGLECFHQYLWGQKFEVVTDHKPLLELLGPDKRYRILLYKPNGAANINAACVALHNIASAAREPALEEDDGDRQFPPAVQQAADIRHHRYGC